MPLLRHLALAAVLALCLPSESAAQNCKKGKPCGHTCIAQDKVCHVGTPTTDSTAAARATERPLMTAAPADSASFSQAPWVASPRGNTYYLSAASCPGAKKLKNRIYFKSEDQAQAAGYRRSVQKGC